jgi:hypothetical protein
MTSAFPISVADWYATKSDPGEILALLSARGVALIVHGMPIGRPEGSNHTSLARRGPPDVKYASVPSAAAEGRPFLRGAHVGT